MMLKIHENVPWKCPNDGELNLDSYRETACPMCGKCGKVFDWEDVLSDSSMKQLNYFMKLDEKERRKKQ